MSDADLLALGEAAGLIVHWTDASGQPQTASAGTVRAAVEALGFPAANEDAIADSRRRLEQSGRDAGPLRVERDSRPPGYYRDPQGHGTIAVPPERCFSVRDAVSGRRACGLAVQLYSLRGGHSADFGDLAALVALTREAAAHGVDAVAVSPMHAPFAAAPESASPYSPSSRYFLNPLYADIALAGDGFAPPADGGGAIIDWKAAGPRKYAALREAFSRFQRAGPSDDFRAFSAEGGERLANHALFEALDGHFRAQNICTWRQWPAAFRDPKGPGIGPFAQAQADAISFHMFLQWIAAKSLHSAQCAARDAGMAIGIVTDLAIGTDPNGSSAWSAPHEFLSGLTVGAPPDALNPHGQDWGLTAVSPTALRAGGYAAFIDTLRTAMRYAGGVRIDHIIGLQRLWLVPQGARADEGIYLRYPLDDLLALVALESHIHRAVVIGEDLGTVPEGFRERLPRHGILGLEVLWFQREGDRFIAPWRWSRDTAAMTTTHDLPTVAGWWAGRDLEWHERLGWLSHHDREGRMGVRAVERESLWSACVQAGVASGTPPPADEPAHAVGAAIGLVAQTPAELAVVPIEDVMNLEQQPNIPGTIDEHPNWRRRLPEGSTLHSPQARANLAALVRRRTVS